MAHDKKRPDIQGLRAIAIIAVLLFHIWPNMFPNGYAGVDIFFVLSGYLMTKLLCRNEINAHVILDFYQRRILRIMPSYLFVLTLVALIGGYLLTEESFRELVNQEFYAVLLISNLRPIVKKIDYFKEIESYNFLLHMWSLAVELQFYLLVPFIFYVDSKLKKKTSNCSLFIIFLWSSSMIAYLYMHFIYESVSFNFTLCRVWQFMFGTFAFSFSKISNNNQSLSTEKQLLIADADANEYKNDARTNELLAYTKQSSVVKVHYQAFHTTNTSRLFNNDLLSYIGDVSYILYLVHWPTIQFFKYFIVVNQIDLLTDLLVKFSYLCISFLIAILLYHIFEKPILSLKNLQNKILSLTGIYHFVLIATVYLLSSNSNTSEHPYLMPNIFSNNVAVNVNISNPGQIIKDLYSVNREKIIKSLNLTIESILVKQYNEPVLKAPLIGNNIVNDTKLIEMQKSFNIYSNYTKAILYNGPNLNHPYEVRKELIRRLTLKMNTSALHVPLKDFLKVNENLLIRLNALKCPKCIYIDYTKIFCDAQYCYSFDKDISIAYFKDGSGHTTLYGRYKLYEPMEKYIQTALRNIMGQ